MKLEVNVIKTKTMSSMYAYAYRLRIGGKLEMSITEEDAAEFIKGFNLFPEPARPTDLKLNKKRFFDIKYS